MKYIVPWNKLFLVFALIVLTACSSAPKKTEVRPAKNAVVEKAPIVKVNSTIKRDYDKALMYIKQGDYLKAEAILKRIINTQPDLPGPYINLGIIRLKEASLTEAETLFEEAKNKNSKNAEVYNYLGIIYRQQGKFKDAEMAYQQAIKLNPEFAKAYLNLGVLNDLYMPNYSVALENYKRYMALRPEDEKIKNWIVELNQRMRASNL